MPIDEFLLFGKISVYPILGKGIGAVETGTLSTSRLETWSWWEIQSWGLGALPRPDFYRKVWSLQHPSGVTTSPHRLTFELRWSTLWCASSIVLGLKRDPAEADIKTILGSDCLLQLKAFISIFFKPFFNS